jgi:hypothetical protein
MLSVEYVTCQTCKSPDTLLNKEARLFFMNCQSCGSRVRFSLSFLSLCFPLNCCLRTVVILLVAIGRGRQVGFPGPGRKEEGHEGLGGQTMRVPAFFHDLCINSNIPPLRNYPCETGVQVLTLCACHIRQKMFRSTTRESLRSMLILKRCLSSSSSSRRYYS